MNHGRQHVKDPAFYTSLEDHPNLFNTPDEAKHRSLRRIFLPAFADRALRANAGVFVSHTDKLVRLVARQMDEHGRVDMQALFNFTTFDVMGDLCFGEPLGLLDNSAYIPWVTHIFAGIRAGTMRQLFTTYRPLTWLFDLVLRPAYQTRIATHVNFSNQRVDKWLAAGPPVKADIWSLVLADPPLALADMYSHARLFMLAGTETTATQLGGLVFQLTAHPPSLARLVREIRSTLPAEKDLTDLSAHRLPFLDACINETFRRYPTVPVAMPRIVRARSLIAGHIVPPGTTVGVSPYAAYTSPRNFHKPLSFRPERWLEMDGEYADDSRGVLRPYSVGPRNCIGQNLANLEMRLILATLLWHFDLELCDEGRRWPEQKVFTLWEKGPLWVRATRATRAA